MPGLWYPAGSRFYTLLEVFSVACFFKQQGLTILAPEDTDLFLKPFGSHFVSWQRLAYS